MKCADFYMSKKQNDPHKGKFAFGTNLSIIIIIISDRLLYYLYIVTS